MGATGYIIKEHGGSLAPQKEVEVTPADGTIDVERVESGDVVNFRIKTAYDGYETINCGSGYASGYFKAIHVKFNDENRRYRLVCILNGGSYTPVAEDFAIYYIKFGWKTGGANADHWYIQEYSRRGNGSFVALEQISLNEYNILIHTPSSWSYANIGILKEDKEDNVTIEHFNGASTAYTPTGTLITTDTPAWKNGALVETNTEDLITKNGLLQLNDRNSINGLGYVILRTDKTFAEQVLETNTIYEVRYNFDLGGNSVTIPSNSVLFFNGGSLNNGTLIGSDLYFGGKYEDAIKVKINGDIITPNFIVTPYSSQIDASKITACTNNCYIRGSISITNGSYVELRTNLFGIGSAEIIFGETLNYGLLITAKENLSIANIHLKKVIPVITEGAYQFFTCIRTFKSSNIYIHDCEIEGALSFRNNNEGLTNIVCENIQVFNCKILTDFSNIYGQEEGQGDSENYPEKDAIDIRGISSVYFHNNICKAKDINRFFKVSALTTSGAPYNVIYHQPTNINIYSNYFYSEASDNKLLKQFIDAFVGSKNISIYNNYMDLGPHQHIFEQKTAKNYGEVDGQSYTDLYYFRIENNYIDLRRCKYPCLIFMTQPNLVLRCANNSVKIKQSLADYQSFIRTYNLDSIYIENNDFESAEGVGGEINFIAQDVEQGGSVSYRKPSNIWFNNNKLTAMAAVNLVSVNKFVAQDNIFFNRGNIHAFVLQDEIKDALFKIASFDDASNVGFIHIGQPTAAGMASINNLSVEMACLPSAQTRIISGSPSMNLKVLGTRLKTQYLYSSDGINYFAFPFKNTVGDTLSRPTPTVFEKGFEYFDTDLGKPIYWTGSKWVDATGNDLQ